MTRLALLLFLLFLALGLLRVMRLFLARILGGFLRGGVAGGQAAPGEMVRDPVCGTWIDRRLALPGRRGAETVPVCSEECRRLLEAG
jgi:hypothetical protein